MGMMALLGQTRKKMQTAVSRLSSVNVTYKQQNAQIHIKPEDITFNGASLSNEKHVFEMNNIKIQLDRNGLHGNTMHLDLGNDVTIEIRRLMREDTCHFG